ncbi:MAG: 3'-5' exonuclease domain-containing protein 2 [Bacteroidaceae bacterium]|nr:3'-5' exonuclease domain-containing protein 2 [Bacteroidaceae bacterium]
MKILYNKFDKARITDLPVAAFPGRIEVVQGIPQAERAIRYLLSQDILGFDTESKPCFQKGQTNKVALLQVSSPTVCFLFRLNMIGLPRCIIDLLSDKRITKVGLSISEDLNKMRVYSMFRNGTFVELQYLAEEFGIEDKSLRKLYANVFGQKISKRQQLSNWEADVLTETQCLYAATDAWACIRLYQELQRLRQVGFRLEKVPEPENNPVTTKQE